MLYFFMKGRRIALRQEKIQHLPERSKEHELNWNACAQELHNNFIYHEIHDTVLPRAFGWASTTPKSSEGVLKSFTASTYLTYTMQKEKEANSASLKCVINSGGCCRNSTLLRSLDEGLWSSSRFQEHNQCCESAPKCRPRPPLPEFFWLVTGLPSAGTACWNTCTVSWTTCRCRHTSSGSLHVATFWASRNCGSARSRRLKATAFSVLSPAGHRGTVTAGTPHRTAAAALSSPAHTPHSQGTGEAQHTFRGTTWRDTTRRTRGKTSPV